MTKLVYIIRTYNVVLGYVLIVINTAYKENVYVTEICRGMWAYFIYTYKVT